MSVTDWDAAALADLIGDAIGGLWGSPPDSSKSDEVDVLVVRGADFRAWNTRRASDAAPRRIPSRSLERRRLAPGDLVLEVSGGSPAQPVGRVLVIDELAVKDAPYPLICSNFCRKLRLKPGVDPFFVKRQLDWMYRSGHTDQFQTSTTNIRNLQVGDFLHGTSIITPDQAVQAALTELLDQTDAIRNSCSTHIRSAARAVERFRQSVLAAACSGRLTADWREQNPDCEGAEKLVGQSAYSIAEPEEGLAELPDKWAWVALGDYARCSRGRFSVRPRNDPSCFDGEHPFIQIGNLNPDGGWVRSHTQTLNAKGLSVSKKFPKGTAVIAIVGATIGNSGLLAYDMCFPDSLVGLETGTPEGNRFVELFLRDRKHAIRHASYSSGGQPNIKLEFLNPYPLALPPLAEQGEIVRRVDRLLTLSDGLQRRVNNAARRVDRSSQAVLAKAFRGELPV